MATTPGLRSSGGRTMPARMNPLGYQQIATAAATGLTPPDGAEIAVISVEVAAVRYRDDGTSPTTAIGMLIPSGLAPQVFFGNLSAVKFINAVGASGALVNVTYYG